jgi:hypothetical protein
VAQKPEDLRTCGACHQKGHVLADCTRTVDVYGFLVGCPLCNTTKHNVDQCKRKPKQGDLFYYMVVKRVGKPPLRSGLDFRFILPKRWAVLTRYPQTCQFAASRRNNRTVQGVEEQVDDPNWANPNSVKSQVHPLEAKATSGLSTFTKSSTPARISNQQLPEERHLAQQRSSFRGPSPPTPATQPTSDNLLLSSPSVSGTMLHDYHGQSAAARPTNPSGSPQIQGKKHVVPLAVSQFSRTPTMSSTPVHNRSGAFAMHPAAQSETKRFETHQASDAPHFEKPSFSEMAKSEPETRFSRGTLSQSPLITCEKCGKPYHHWSYCDSRAGYVRK